MFNPRRPLLKSRLASGRCLGVVWMSMGSAALVEIAAQAKPDALVIDLQHGLWDRRELEAAIGLVPDEIPVIVRVAENTALAISTALDAGAEGIIVPLVETAKEARAAVRHAKYPPHGRRSGGGVRPLVDFPAYFEGSDNIVVMIMIETEKGVAHAEKIAIVEGVDMVFIGTGDLALSLGTFPAHTHDHTRACATIHRACQKAWIPCGIFTLNADMACMRREQGYRMVVVANDVDVVQRGFGASVERFRPAALPDSHR